MDNNQGFTSLVAGVDRECMGKGLPCTGKYTRGISTKPNRRRVEFTGLSKSQRREIPFTKRHP